MLYVVQENVFREQNYDKIFQALERLNLSYEVVKIENDGKLSKVKTDRKDVFVFGSIRAARLSTQLGWLPGSLYGNNHDYMIYSKFYKDNLLNWNCKLANIEDTIRWEPNELKFIRPCQDSKVFNGGLYTQAKWIDIVAGIQEKYHGVLPPVDIQIGEPKKIYKEARIWVVNGKVVTSSYYKFGDNVAYLEDVEPEAIEFTKQMIKIYQVATAFVMDICLTPDGWKIVEINCINCAGFYKADMQKLLMSLEDYYTPSLNLFSN